MEYTVCAKVLRYYEAHLEANSKEEALIQAKEMYDYDGMDDYEDKLISMEVFEEFNGE